MREDWVEVKIEELISDNGVFSDGDWVESKDQDPNGEVRLIQLADIGDGKFIDKSNRFLTSEKSKELNCTILKEKDILLARMPKPLGRATLFPLIGKGKYVTVVDVAIIRPDHKWVDIKYLLYNVNSPFTRRNIEALQSGTTRKRISRKNLSKINFPLAPLPEQQAIVAKIEQLFSELDNGIANLKTAKDKLKIYRQAVLKKAFEGELTKEWRKKSTQENKDDLEGWVWHKLEKVSEFITKGTTPKKDKLNKKNAKIPFIKVYNLTHTGKIDFSINPTYIDEDTHTKFLKRSIVKPDDILMNIVGPPLGKVSIVPHSFNEWNINQAIVRFRPFNVLKPKYLMHYLLCQLTINDISKKAKATAGQFNLTLEICRNIEISIPPTEEQTQIVKEIETRLSVCDNAIKNINEALKKSEALRQSILKKAFEGKLLSDAELQACRQEPDWEPAEKLLERIKKEKK